MSSILFLTVVQLFGRLTQISPSKCESLSQHETSNACDYICHPKPNYSPSQGRVVFASELYRSPSEVSEQKTQYVAPKLTDCVYDVAIVGAGVVGCAIAYRLSMLHGLRTILFDENVDVGEGTSKANSAIIHTGFDAEPGSLESVLLHEASSEWPQLAQKLKIPYKVVGAMVVATNEEEEKKLSEVLLKAKENNVFDCVHLSKQQIRLLEKNVSNNICGGVFVPREAIVDPFAVPIAFAEVALKNGADICLGAKIHTIRTYKKDYRGKPNEIIFRPSHKDCPSISLSEKDIVVRAKHVINASGLGSRKLAESYDPNTAELLDINPRRGEFMILKDGDLVNRIILPMPNKVTKGILVTPTIFGNTLCGPTAEDLPSSAIHDTPVVTRSGLDAVLRDSALLVPKVINAEVVTTYAGHRCNRKGGSYFVYHDQEMGISTISGVRSTGLSTSPAFSKLIVNQLFPHVPIKQDAVDNRERYPPWYNRTEGEGIIVCSHENVFEETIRESLRSPLRIHTLDSVKRRTRALMGICQGLDCQERVAEIVREETGVEKVTKRGCDSFSLQKDS